MKKAILSAAALLLCAGVLLFSGCRARQTGGESTTGSTGSRSDSSLAPQSTADGSTQAQSTLPDSTQGSTAGVTALNPASSTANKVVKVTEPEVTSVRNIDSRSWNADGTYKCGNNAQSLIPGEYRVVGNSSSYSLYITNGAGLGINATDLSGPTLVTLKSGYTITVTGGKIILAENAGSFANAYGSYSDGMYKVGRDIPAGEYVAKKSPSAPLYCGMSFYANTDLFDEKTPDIIFVDAPIYITLETGEYVQVVQGSLAPASSQQSASPESDGHYSPRMYKVGKDLQPGRYQLIATGSSGMYSIYKDSLHNSDSRTSVERVNGSKELTLTDGQYIEFFDCKLLPVNESATLTNPAATQS